jgi:hypothetical protein
MVWVMVAMGLAISTARQPADAAVTMRVSDGRVALGDYVEIDTQGQANWDFSLGVLQVTPNIIHLRGKNGWLAFASFDALKKEYRGFFEWPDHPDAGRPGGKWAELYQIRVVVQDGVLRIEGKSAGNEIQIRAKPARDFAVPATTKPRP